MSFTDFPNGLSDVNQYLNAQHHTRLDLQGSTADIGRFVVQADYSTSLKEVICSLLAGRGLRLPNVQLCLFVNLQELLGIPQLQSALSAALNELSAGLQRFLDHTRISDVLGRINNVLAEVTNIANMINFCSTPIDPVAIPNILEQSMQSFLGAGQDIINRIGELVPGEIGGCITPGGFNCTAFSGGLLGRICDNFPAVSTGTASDDFIDACIADINSIVNDIDTLIDNENGVTGVYDQGGSDFIEEPRPVNDTVGVLHNGPDEGIQGNTRIAGQLKALYDNLGSYQVVGNDGTVYNNIFETFVEPDLLRLLRRQDDPRPQVSNRQPVFNYCGEITGYTEAITQSQELSSSGTTPGDIDQPGFNAGGLPTNPVITDGEDDSAGDGGDTINNITNVTNVNGTTLFAASEAAMIALNPDQGVMVYRTDTGETFVKNSGTTGTVADFNIIGSGAGGSTLGAFLQAVDSSTGTGLLSRSGDTPAYRTVTGTGSQITVTNGNGASGNPTIALADNPVIPGTGALRLPIGITTDRIDVNGNIRYNSQTNFFEGYMNGAWQNFSVGSSGVTDGSNVGGGSFEVYKQNSGGILEFRTINVDGAITASVASDIITINENLTVSNLGSGETLATRTGNAVQVKSIVAGNGVDISSDANEVTISTDVPVFNAAVQTTDATPTVVPFVGITPANGNGWFVEIQATARNGADITSIKQEGIVNHNGGTVSYVGGVGNRTVYNSTPATSGWDLTIDVNANALRVQVTGAASTTIDWAVRITYHEV